MMTKTPANEQYGILTDVTKCTGCEQCVAACKQYNGKREGRNMKRDLPRRWKTSIDDLSLTRYTTIVRRPGNHYVRKQCRHCVEPACVSACIVGALRKEPTGAVSDCFPKCIGCRYCMTACPFGIPRYDWSAPNPFMRKCNLCYQRIADGQSQPACTQACPEGATIFGKRGDLLKIARERLAAEPGKYVPKVYGESEVGGTCVLYVSDIPLDFLAWNAQAMDDTPLPERTWAAMKKVPTISLGMAGLMAGTWWVIGRRMKLQTGQQNADERGHTPTGTDDRGAQTD